MLAIALSAPLAVAGCGSEAPGEARQALPAAEQSQTPERPQRVVLVTLDTLRLDALGHMPKLTAWAAAGTVFERYYSCSSTTQPAHATMLTGLHPWEHGVTANGMVLADALETVPERLRAAGFRTAAVVASFPVHGDFGFAQGFERYDHDFGGGEGPERNNRNLHSSAAQVTDRALRLLDELDGERQLFWFHYFDPHSPYGDHSGVRGVGASPGKILDGIASGEHEAAERVAWAKDLYEGDLGYLDRHVGRLLKALERSTEYETHVLIVSDHGESFGEQGSMGHGKRLTREQIHVPLLVRSPRLDVGARAEPVGSADVAATLLAVAGLETPRGNGRSLFEPGEVDRPILGQRRSFAEAYAELRTDGQQHPLAEHWFFLALDGEVVTGNAASVSSWDTGAPVADADLAARCRTLFAELEALAAELDTSTLDDVESLQSLRSLGYTR